ncbi:MAG: hypothetical protein WBA25_07615 [Jannaschia sp.]
MPSYRTSSMLTAFACTMLCLTLALVPSVVSWLFQLDGATVGDDLALRAAILFLGLAAIAWFGRDAPDSTLRRAVAIGFAVVWAGLALAGLYEFVRGTVGPGIWLAIVAEVALSVISARHVEGEAEA